MKSITKLETHDVIEALNDWLRKNKVIADDQWINQDNLGHVYASTTFESKTITIELDLADVKPAATTNITCTSNNKHYVPR